MSTGSSAQEAGDHPSDVLENAFYKSVRKSDASDARRTGAESHPAASKSRAISLAAPEAAPTSTQSEETEAVDGMAESDARALTGSSSGTSAPAKPPSAAPKGAPKVPYVFWDGASLLALTRKHNLTIAQIMWENECTLTPPEEVRAKLLHIWDTMDNCIREGVHNTDTHLPGSLRLRRRAPGLYARLTRGFYADGRSGRAGGPSISAPGSDEGGLAVAAGAAPAAGHVTRTRNKGPPHVHGRFDHPIVPIPPRRTTFPSSDFLSCYAIAVNEVNATGGRVVVAPTLGAAGGEWPDAGPSGTRADIMWGHAVLPSVLKYITEFISEDDERDIQTYLLTAAAIGMLIKRGATISVSTQRAHAETAILADLSLRRRLPRVDAWLRSAVPALWRLGLSLRAWVLGESAFMLARLLVHSMLTFISSLSPEVIEHAAEIGIEVSLRARAVVRSCADASSALPSAQPRKYSSALTLMGLLLTLLLS